MPRARPLNLFLQDLESGAYSLDCGHQDLARIPALITRYADLPLGFADALDQSSISSWPYGWDARPGPQFTESWS